MHYIANRCLRFSLSKGIKMMVNSKTLQLTCAAFLLTSFSMAEYLHAERQSTQTVITVREMCGGCVRKITKKLQTMDGVANFKCDVKTKTVLIAPKNSVVLSPRKLWDAMDKIGKTPTKLVGPSGTFTSPPKN